MLYNRKEPDFTLLDGTARGRNQLRLARSGDGGKSFIAPVDIATEAIEGAMGSPGMINLFVAGNGDLYASWLDYREFFSYLITNKKEPPKEHPLDTHLRVARSSDGGLSFAASTLVTKPVCGCCGTKVAQGQGGPLYASTRAAWPELKGSVDAVRDMIVSASQDHGASWSKPVKVHDDRFKISGCPDVAPGLSVDSKGRLHAAWYTGTEGRPGIYYAVSSDHGESFSEPLALLTDEWVPYADVKLALDSHDNAGVAFEDRRGETDLIHLVRVTPSGTVSRAEPWPGTIPDMDARGGSAVVTWGSSGPTPTKRAARCMCAHRWVLLILIIGFVAAARAMEPRPLPDYRTRLLGSDQEVGFAGFFGQAILIKTWATWCPPCREETPDFEAIYQRYRDQGLVVIGVNIDEGQADEAVARYVRGMGISFAIWRDPNNRFSKRFRSLGAPETFLVDRNGMIIRHWQGPGPQCQQQSGSHPNGSGHCSGSRCGGSDRGSGSHAQVRKAACRATRLPDLPLHRRFARRRSDLERIDR
ncbi:MAG: redoxin domain-containing protein [Methylococcales bacterium]